MTSPPLTFPVMHAAGLNTTSIFTPALAMV